MKYICDDKRHLICLPYSVENLHLMAEDLNIKRCWFHNAKFAHYDIPKKRISEIKAKCEVVSPKDLLFMLRFGNETQD